MAMHQVKIWKLFLFGLIFSIGGAYIHAQTTDDLIKHEEEKLKEQQDKVQKITDEIEELKLQKIRETLKKYIPKGPAVNEIITHSAMIIGYNEVHEQPNWVMHIIPKDVITGIETRSNDFRPDSLVTSGTSDVEDYWDSGYDRGHMAPSADFRWSKKALSESYYYSNISPQTPELNREAWSNLEMQIREWVVQYGDLLVITGPVLKDSLPKIQQGSYRVSIPEADFKIVVDLNREQPRALAFLYPNTKDVKDKIQDYVVTIDSIEKITGITFFPNLPQAESFKKVSDLNSWGQSSTQISQAPEFKYDLNHVPTRQSIYFLGTECNVCGEVVATRYNKNTTTKITYINFDELYPNSPFTAVIFGKDRINFSYEPEVYLKGKKICVRGLVQLYKGKPQIVATNEKQFTLYKP